MKKAPWIAAGLVVAGITIALFLPRFRGAREVARRATCKNNLKHIGLALHAYHDEYGSFPPAFIPDEEGHPAHSWRVLLLPYMDEQKLYSQYRFDEPWDSPHNSTLANKIPSAYRCPSIVKSHRHHDLETEHSLWMTDYVAISTAGAVFDGTQTTSIEEIHDGTDKTLVVAEVRPHSVHWMQPTDVTPHELMSDLLYSTQDDHANHIDGLHVLHANRSARFLSAKTTLKELQEMVSLDGNESMAED